MRRRLLVLACTLFVFAALAVTLPTVLAHSGPNGPLAAQYPTRTMASEPSGPIRFPHRVDTYKGSRLGSSTMLTHSESRWAGEGFQTKASGQIYRTQNGFQYSEGRHIPQRMLDLKSSGYNPIRSKMICQSLLTELTTPLLDFMLEKKTITPQMYELQKEITDGLEQDRVTFLHGLKPNVDLDQAEVGTIWVINGHTLTLHERDSVTNPKYQFEFRPLPLKGSLRKDLRRLPTDPRQREYEVGHATVREGRETLELLTSLAEIFIYFDVRETGGDIHKTYVNAHSLDKAHGQLYARKYKMPTLEATESPQEIIHRKDLVSMIQDHPPSRYSAPLAKIKQILGPLHTELLGLEIFWQMKSSINRVYNLKLTSGLKNTAPQDAPPGEISRALRQHFESLEQEFSNAVLRDFSFLTELHTANFLLQTLGLPASQARDLSRQLTGTVEPVGLYLDQRNDLAPPDFSTDVYYRPSQVASSQDLANYRRNYGNMAWRILGGDRMPVERFLIRGIHDYRGWLKSSRILEVSFSHLNPEEPHFHQRLVGLASHLHEQLTGYVTKGLITKSEIDSLTLGLRTHSADGAAALQAAGGTEHVIEHSDAVQKTVRVGTGALGFTTSFNLADAVHDSIWTWNLTTLAAQAKTAKVRVERNSRAEREFNTLNLRPF